MSSGPRILPVRINVAGKSLRFHFLIQIRFGFHGLITMSNNHDRSEDEPIEAILVSAPADNTSLVDRLGQQSRCLLYTSPSPRDVEESRMPSSA